MRTTARTWFSDAAEFRQLCGDALSQAQWEREQEFATEMMIEANKGGLDTPISREQLAWLCSIADWEEPRTIER